MSRIGIFSGTFDPVHKGHLAFALQAISIANLEKVYFLPEILPRRKRGVTHIAHRLAMLERAVKPHPNLGIIELPDKQFSVAKTLPRLQKRFSGDQLFFLLGADKELAYLPEWPMAMQLLKSSGLIIAQRDKSRSQTELLIKKLPVVPSGLYVLETQYPEISSAEIRRSIRSHKKPEGAVSSTLPYADKNWLYDVVSSKSS